MRKILIANRGEIACRIQRTCREMGIATVAVFSDPDRNAPFVLTADEAVPLGGAAPSESYLRIDALIAAAQRTGADAIHPGYGFLSENAGFAERCREAGLIFIGPPTAAIAAMGSKVEAKRRMAAAGVPLLPSFEVGAAPADSPALRSAAQTLGFPLLVKASAGGGGKGMRIVRGADELVEAVESARREATAAFGDGTVYLERYLDHARHVEVQIFGDTHGQVIHLYERECSIQRRHQKIVEESPCPALTPELRAALCRAAVTAGEAIGYQNAGTVEFMLAAGGEFFFLEVNTRLQVEHPVTEAITGLDLVRLQIAVARGERLPSQAEIAPVNGHAIEVRLYAEDAEHDFMPSTGRLHRFRIDARPGLRIDSGVADGSEVSVYYDPMLAKVIAWAPTRREAADRLAAALASAQIHGVRTNRDLLVRILRHPEFLAGDTDTRFLERHPPAILGAPLCDAQGQRLHALAAALTAQAARRAAASAVGFAPSGWRNLPSRDQTMSFAAPSGQLDIGYRFERNHVRATVNGDAMADLHLDRCTPDEIDLTVGGVRRRVTCARVGDRVFVDSALGATELRTLPRFPDAAADEPAGSLVAPMPGVVRQVRVQVGDQVAAGDVLIILEAMKMEQQVRAPAAGRIVTLHAAVGEQVEAGRVLAVIEEDANG